MAAQRSFFDEEHRLEKLSRQGDPLEKLRDAVDWEIFRPLLKQAFEKENKGPGGRPAFDGVMMWKVLVLQRLYNLSDAQMEFQLNDRLSFMRFVGLDLADRVPDEKTIWVYRERLREAGVLDKLFERFLAYVEQQGMEMKGGRIVEASIVEVPKQRNRREENEQIRQGKRPEGWSEAQKRQKDTDARWVVKGGVKYFGYKNHVKVEVGTKLIQKYTVTDASVHDSQVVESLLEDKDGGRELYGDAAYSGEPIRQLLEEKRILNRVHEKGYRRRPLGEEQRERNREKSKVRARVEHVFGFQYTSMRCRLLRVVGLARARLVIGLMNLSYNLCRFVQLQCLYAKG